MTTETTIATRRAALRDLVTAGGQNDATAWRAAQRRAAALAKSPPAVPAFLLEDAYAPTKGNAAVERDLASLTIQRSSI